MLLREQQVQNTVPTAPHNQITCIYSWCLWIQTTWREGLSGLDSHHMPASWLILDPGNGRIWPLSFLLNGSRRQRAAVTLPSRHSDRRLTHQLKTVVQTKGDNWLQCQTEYWRISKSSGTGRGGTSWAQNTAQACTEPRALQYRHVGSRDVSGDWGEGPACCAAELRLQSVNNESHGGV